ncbi:MULTISPECIES: proline/glycine betaine ABC transporter permease [unclassified Hyphomicrobium]|uniref:ABC transporter permease n=1 Tax=unclassified Hyphomicrobium TaxID=2619925 RepID=UPI000213D65B|nr:MULTISPECIES: ABC transporter permease subunit [unclassified Hyphomicrobium]CCB67494.1 Binding-protein-dependent transport systems inner membrane component [Hyphomicrobium sp. MC1]
MTVADTTAPIRPSAISTPTLIWIVAIAVVAILYLIPSVAPWAVKYPDAAIIPISKWISAIMAWLKSNFMWLTRGITDVFNVPLQWAIDLLAKGWKSGYGPTAVVLPRLSWIGVCAAFAIAGYKFGGWRLSALAAACMLYIALFGQWTSAMLTLALIVISVPLCVIVGLMLGVVAFRKPWIDRTIIQPMLDLMQTMPTFAYLIPMLLLFGNSPVSGMLATAIFAMPPMVRATVLALKRVPHEIDDFGEMVGCTQRQKLWWVLVPSGRATLMVGVNQVIMLALNMVIISSMIGAGGLGYDVLLALRALKIGQGMEAGLAIVALAIVLDRLSQAAARQRPAMHVQDQNFIQRNPMLTLAVAILAVTTILSVYVPAFAAVPAAIKVSTAPYWKAAVDWINIHFFDAIEAFRTFLLLYILNPIRDFLVDFPWLGMVLLVGLAGYRLSGMRLAVLVVLMTSFCAVTGLWEKSMATLYLCGVSAIICAVFGIAIGILASRSDRFAAFLTPVLDTLQTLPSFCFIIPVVMLFRVGDVTAMIATVLFAIVPAIRYTNHGIRQIPESLIEAATVSGCTPRQMFWRVQLPLALPEIMLGINQTVLLALSMIIICAMIGTRDLGQEVFIALAKADAGRGLTAGFAIAFIGIVSDRLIRASTDRLQSRMGLS